MSKDLLFALLSLDVYNRGFGADHEQVEAFVSGGAGTDKEADEPLKRVSINVPESLHTRFKVACAKAKCKMAPEIIAFIERHVIELENETT